MYYVHASQNNGLVHWNAFYAFHMQGPAEQFMRQTPGAVAVSEQLVRDVLNNDSSEFVAIRDPHCNVEYLRCVTQREPIAQ